MYRIIITGLKEIVQITDRSDIEFLKGRDMARIKVLSDPKNHLAVLVAMDGTIAAVGKLEEVLKVQNGQPVEGSLNTNGGILLPGFVDGHSHPVFAGDRVHEFAMKLAGATYMEVQAAGGGIHFTTEKTREATEGSLVEDFKKIAHVMLQNGTTTLEAKSGYGLNTESELKMLRVLDRVNDDTPLEISATFCGGHAVPKARAMSHLEEISDEGIRGMAKSGTVAVVLPSTAFILRLTPPPVRKMIENGVIVALGSDFNPNAYCLAMPMIMHLGERL
ncbi:putative imidazolonepropionase [Teladorsagia circumcincta]|uniref:imidazolonepropionase n=1 Tax=Teladorsagia circumcincta TaxID=45464 RepID=A0A2G9UJD1_TELCI|nr:putative imidazolonepropionase [Teladorsagia circumcincta]